MSTAAKSMVPLDFQHLPEEEMLRRASELYAQMNRRRTTRHFSDRAVPRELIENAIRTAGTAPSGAHQQPWTFVAISDPAIKRMMREAAEEEERVNYGGRMPPEWLEALAPLGTDAVKEHITTAPYVVVLFRHVYGVRADGTRRTHYYSTESCGIAAGLFVAAIHQMGLATLTHTPSPMGFLTRLLRRPANEKPFLLMPVGYPAPDARVPDLARKPLDEIAVWFEAEGEGEGGTG
ncbi:MAG TPA: nitroreductase family protein [Longimicrobium sp.]|jgi:nitroreductase|uniref:nitroreductase family protein n=1 Tax=Longimicrobium sp. TaxID=2029185 RepID=UPI002ED8587F